MKRVWGVGAVCLLSAWTVLGAERKPFVPQWKKVAAAPEPRLEKIRPVAPGELRLEPMFATVGITYGATNVPGLAFRYRVSGTTNAWQTTFAPTWFDEVANWRGMAWQLAEDTAYDLEVVADGRTLAAKTFRTWKSDVPIARTVTLDPVTVKFPLVVSEKGSPEGWIRFVAKDGAPLVNTNALETLILVTNAAHVVFDDLTIRGGPCRHVFWLTDSTGVRVRNADISAWGRAAKCYVDHAGRFFSGYDRKRRRPRDGNHVDGVYVGPGMKETVVERCYIHDPVSRSTAWRYSHPTGPMAVVMGRPDHSTSIRFNDFVGSDNHRWDDAVGGSGNFSPDGGFNRTGEVYGNFMIYPNDDSIELDGGQQNIACFRNRFEAGLCGVSIQGNVVSPSYVFENLFAGMCDEFGEVGQSVKTSGFDIFGQGPYSAVFRNTWFGRGTVLSIDGIVHSRDPNHPTSDAGRIARIDVLDNVFCPAGGVKGAEKQPQCVVAGNRFGVPLAEAELDRALPYRPLPFTLDRVRLDVGLDHAPVTLHAVGGAGTPYRIVKPDDMDWFSVSPAAGTLTGDQAFTVSFHEEKLGERPIYRGAFLVRTANGLSRPVSVYVATSWRQPERCEGPGDVAVYRHPRDGVKDEDGFTTYVFEAPKAARYYFMVFAQAAKRPQVQAAVDGEEPGLAVVQSADAFPVWSILAPGQPMWSVKPGRISYYDLEKGPHRLRVRPRRGKFRPVAFVMTDNPLAFEPKIAWTERGEDHFVVPSSVKTNEVRLVK